MDEAALRRFKQSIPASDSGKFQRGSRKRFASSIQFRLQANLLQCKRHLSRKVGSAAMSAMVHRDVFDDDLVFTFADDLRAHSKFCAVVITEAASFKV